MIVGPIFILLVLIGIAAIIVWIADWASGGRDLPVNASLERADISAVDTSSYANAS